MAEHVDAGDLGPPGVGLGEGGQRLDDGRLAGPVRAEQRKHGAGSDLEAQIVERLGATAICLAEPLDVDCRIVSGLLPLRSREGR